MITSRRTRHRTRPSSVRCTRMGRMRLAPVMAIALAALLNACDEAPPSAPDFDATPQFKSEEGEGKGQFISVITRNLYIGTDVGTVLQAPPDQVPIFISLAYGEVVASRPAERMAAMAAEIVQSRPEVVGLQEVSQFFTQTPGDFLAGDPVQATDLQFDFLELLLDALRAKGVHYDVASVVENADLELPAVDFQTGQFFDVRLVDRDVILVRKGVPFGNVRSGNFQAALPVTIGPVSFSFLRGWNSVDVRVHGRDVRVLNAHLETQGAGPLNQIQGSELIEIASASPLPVVLVGDFNSAANASALEDRKTPTYGNILAAGFTDAWLAGNPGDEGLTCCHAPSLTGAEPFDQRIDFVFYRGDLGGVEPNEILGGESSPQTASGLWPSDHAGIFSRIRLR